MSRLELVQIIKSELEEQAGRFHAWCMEEDSILDEQTFEHVPIIGFKYDGLIDLGELADRILAALPL